MPRPSQPQPTTASTANATKILEIFENPEKTDEALSAIGTGVNRIWSQIDTIRPQIVN